MPRHTIPLRNGTFDVPAFTRIGTVSITLKGDSSITVTDPNGNEWLHAELPGAKAADTATVTKSVSSPDDLHAGTYTVAITGNVTASVVVSQPQ